MALTEEQRQEAEKLLRLARQYEGIIRTSRNSEQLRRTKVELKKIRDQLETYFPDGLPEPGASLSTPMNPAASQRKSVEDGIQGYQVLSNIPINKASLHSEDDDVNVISSVLSFLEKEIMPSLTDRHVKLDFSLNAERDSHYSKLENVKRQLKILTDTLDDLNRATRDDMKLQLRQMKERYTRHFLHEAGMLIKTILGFWSKIDEDNQRGGNRCLNKDEEISYDRKFEEASFFEGKTVSQAIAMSVTLLQETLDFVAIPDLD